MNRASMRPEQNAPDNQLESYETASGDVASMRPEQNAPDNEL